MLIRSSLNPEDITYVFEGNRWHGYSQGLKTINRLFFFDELDKQKIDFDHEIERISKEYDGFNLYACDRYITQLERKTQTKLLVYTFLFYESMFSQGIRYYFTTGIAFTYNLVSYEVSKKRGIKHVSFYGTRYKNKTAISLNVKNSFYEVEELYTTYKKEKVTPKMLERVSEFVERPVQPSYMKNAINASTIKGVFLKEFFIRFKRFYLDKRHHYDLFTRNPFELSRFKLNKIWQAKKINRKHDKLFDKPNYEEKYFIFPLHMQPEASTLILAPFHVNQLSTIINLSKCLPLNSKLYVKEHKSALGQHKESFYKELRKYSNIRVISYREDMFQLIQNCLGTIVLSSTVGLESLFLKKPTIVLGEVFYNATGLVFKINCLNKIKDVLQKILSSEFNIDNEFQEYDQKLAFYLDCLINGSYPFEFNVAKLDTKKRVLREENVNEFGKCLAKLISS